MRDSQAVGSLAFNSGVAVGFSTICFVDGRFGAFLPVRCVVWDGRPTLRTGDPLRAIAPALCLILSAAFFDARVFLAATSTSLVVASSFLCVENEVTSLIPRRCP